MGIKATAAVVHEPEGNFKFLEVELEDPRDDEIVIRLEGSGVCQTDVHAQHMLPMPAVLGHEGTGVVESVGKSASRVKVGDRVVMSYPWCGTCPNCLKGKKHICDHDVELNFGGSRLDGSKPVSLDGQPVSSAFFQQSSFASHAITPERDVVVVDDLSIAMRAALPCGVLTGAGTIFNEFGLTVGNSLLVAGAGAVGLSAVMAAKIAGASPIIVADIVDSRLDLARELGATHTINSRGVDISEAVTEISRRGVEFALDTTGNEHVLNQLIASLGLGGVCAMVTAPNMGETYPFPMTELFLRAGQLRGIFLGSSDPAVIIPSLIELNREGRFPYERLITEYKFEDINQAFEDSKNGRVIKPILIMD